MITAATGCCCASFPAPSEPTLLSVHISQRGLKRVAAHQSAAARRKLSFQAHIVLDSHPHLPLHVAHGLHLADRCSQPQNPGESAPCKREPSHEGRDFTSKTIQSVEPHATSLPSIFRRVHRSGWKEPSGQGQGALHLSNPTQFATLQIICPKPIPEILPI